jgi:hypothetical protein
VTSQGQDETDQLQFYVVNTLLKNLRQPKLKSLGISHATLTMVDGGVVNYDPTGRVKMSDARGGRGALSGPSGFGVAPKDRDVKFQKIDKTTFKLEFIWKRTPPSMRQAVAAATDNPGEATPGDPPMPTSTPGTPSMP